MRARAANALRCLQRTPFLGIEFRHAVGPNAPKLDTATASGHKRLPCLDHSSFHSVTAIACDTVWIVSLVQRVDDQSWIFSVDRHRRGPGGPSRPCPNYEQGRIGAELWVTRHQARLRQDVAAINRWREPQPSDCSAGPAPGARCFMDHDGVAGPEVLPAVGRQLLWTIADVLVGWGRAR